MRCTIILVLFVMLVSSGDASNTPNICARLIGEHTILRSIVDVPHESEYAGGYIDSIHAAAAEARRLHALEGCDESFDT